MMITKTTHEEIESRWSSHVQTMVMRKQKLSVIKVSRDRRMEQNWQCGGDVIERLSE